MTAVLVTGVGAIIGYGVLRSLRSSERRVRLVGADIYPDAAGQAWADHFVQAPLTSSENYLSWLEKTIVENRINLVIPGIEQDVHCFSRNRGLFDRLQVKVALNDERLIDLTQDKWLMFQELERIDSAARIETRLTGNFDVFSKSFGLPFILKPRRSYASKGLVRVRSEADFLALQEKLGDELMAQPIVGSDNEEYTVGAFGDGKGEVCALISFQRRLAADGSTVNARVRHDASLNEMVASLFLHFKPIGPTNLQFRKTEEGWKLLEINPRISSATSLRTAFGYNEAAMCLDFYLEGKSINQPVIRGGFGVRYIEDFVIYDRDHF